MPWLRFGGAFLVCLLTRRHKAFFARGNNVPVKRPECYPLKFSVDQQLMISWRRRNHYNCDTSNCLPSPGSSPPVPNTRSGPKGMFRAVNITDTLNSNRFHCLLSSRHMSTACSKKNRPLDGYLSALALLFPPPTSQVCSSQCETFLHPSENLRSKAPWSQRRGAAQQDPAECPD